MYHDLNVCVPVCERERALQTLITLGYDVVAMTTLVSGQKKLNRDQLPDHGKSNFFKDTRSVRFRIRNVYPSHMLGFWVIANAVWKLFFCIELCCIEC